ncbi:hypothetical protein DE146DRAFT_632014 [Phaeosphaeria sp. MPI-PUGE-AT-0046c]|nr:hypothetical protein DE146DRAFT_632014 [Phaeosphaeria sp. MPI-PUGE-AT-0046c]
MATLLILGDLMTPLLTLHLLHVKFSHQTPIILKPTVYQPSNRTTATSASRDRNISTTSLTKYVIPNGTLATSFGSMFDYANMDLMTLLILSLGLLVVLSFSHVTIPLLVQVERMNSRITLLVFFLEFLVSSFVGRLCDGVHFIAFFTGSSISFTTFYAVNIFIPIKSNSENGEYGEWATFALKDAVRIGVVLNENAQELVNTRFGAFDFEKHAPRKKEHELEDKTLVPVGIF